MNNLSSFTGAHVNTPPAIAGGILNTLDSMQQAGQSHGYDPFGKRISKTVGVNTTYYYSEDGLVAEADSSGVVTTSYHYQLKTPWGTDPMFIRQGGVYGYYVTDHLGTPQRVVGSNGAVLWGAVYDAFGEADLATASLVNNLRFPGQYFDLESGLHFNYWRYYDSGVGGYVSSDRIGLGGGLNTYAYVFNNPVKHIDPTGEGVGAAAVCAAIEVTGFAMASYSIASIYNESIQNLKDQIDLLKKAQDECGSSDKDMERLAILKDMIRDLTLQVAQMQMQSAAGTFDIEAALAVGAATCGSILILPSF